MKKMFVLLTMALVLMGHSAFASGNDNVNREVREMFKREFPGAQHASWEKLEAENLYVVRFVYDNQGFIAYFYPYGEMIASARLVSKDNLPYKVSNAVKKQFGDVTILKIEELAMEGSLSYFFTIENQGEKIALRVHHDGSVERLRSRKLRAAKKQ